MAKQGISNRESPQDEAQERKEFPPKALDADEDEAVATGDDSDFDGFDDDTSDDEADETE